MLNNGNQGIGEILYESANIAFDTTRGIYFDPVTNTIFGATPPPGGWAINWYGTPANINVPVGQGVIAQTQAQADIIRAQVQAQLTGAGSSTNATNQSSGQNVVTQPTTQLVTGLYDYLNTHSMFGISDLYLAIGLVAIGGHAMFHTSRRGRR